MSEMQLVWLVPVRLGIVVIFSLFYVLGGRSWKPFRRILGGLWISGSVILLSLLLGSFKWWILFALPSYVIALSLGYGSDTLWLKIARRATYGLALGGCSLIVASVTGSWHLGLLQAILAIFASLYLGVLNPARSAVNEEALVASLSVIVVPFLV